MYEVRANIDGVRRVNGKVLGPAHAITQPLGKEAAQRYAARVRKMGLYKMVRVIKVGGAE